MRSIRPYAVISLLAVCVLPRAAEPQVELDRRQLATVEQLQKQIATLQAQVAELRSVLQISQGNVQLLGNSVSIVSSSTLAVQAGTNLTASVGGAATVQVAKDLSVTGDNVLFDGRKSFILRPAMDLTLHVGRNLTSSAGANMLLRSSGQATLEAGGTLHLKGAVINQN